MDYRNNILFLSEKLKNKNVSNMERKVFTIDRNILKTKEQLIQEYIKLMAYLAHDSSLEFDDHQNVLKVLNELGCVIDNYNNLDNNEINLIKKVIVYIDLLVGFKVSFYSTFLEMYNSNELNINYNTLINNNNFNYEYLCNYFNIHKNIRDYYINFRYKVAKICKKLENKFSIKKEKQYSSYDDFIKSFYVEYNKLRITVSMLLSVDYDKSRDFLELLNDLEYEILNQDIEESIEFAKKVINYIEIEFNLNISYPVTFVRMLNNDELDINYKELSLNKEFNLEYLKNKFNYNRGLSFGK